MVKEGTTFHVDDCIFAKSAQTAKKRYQETRENTVQSVSTEKAVEAANVTGQKTKSSESETTKLPLRAIAYTDGSYNKYTGQYGYGVYMEFGEEKYECYGGAQDTTGGWQVNGELEAALTAIQKAIDFGCESVEIRYDYEGVRMWADGEWCARKKYTAAYQRKVNAYRSQIKISFSHIKSHTGNRGNERADDLAKAGAGLASPEALKSSHSADTLVLIPEAAQIKTETPTDDKFPKGNDGIGLQVNPACRNAILAFRRKKKHAFKDFMLLKTGGLDGYSRTKAEDLKKYAEENHICIAEELPDEKMALTAIRWILRGLSVEDAVHKVKVDAEVSENATKRNAYW